MAETPQEPEEAFVEGGATALRQAMPILTRKQAEKLFREAWRIAEVNREIAHGEWERWFQSRERERARTSAPPPPPQADAAELRLGVRPGASVEEIQAAWRRQAQLYHPDRGGDDATMAQINADRDALLKRRRAA